MFGDQLGRDFGAGRARHGRWRHRGADVRAELELGVGEVLRGGKRTFQVPTSTACERCGGVGFVGRHVCPTCGGVGALHGLRTIELTVPKEPRQGMVLRLAGLGEVGDEGGETGDLLLTLRIASDDVFRLLDPDVETDLPVLPWEAVFGARSRSRRPGRASVRVPRGRAPVPGCAARTGIPDGRGRAATLLVVRLSCRRARVQGPASSRGPGRAR
jgi:DnaJ-class molecular chaperone